LYQVQVEQDTAPVHIQYYYKVDLIFYGNTPESMLGHGPLLDTQGNSKLVLALLLFLGYTRAAEKLGAENSGNPGKGLKRRARRRACIARRSLRHGATKA
jgi:hypothetical protein